MKKRGSGLLIFCLLIFLLLDLYRTMLIPDPDPKQGHWGEVNGYWVIKFGEGVDWLIFFMYVLTMKHIRIWERAISANSCSLIAVRMQYIVTRQWCTVHRVHPMVPILNWLPSPLGGVNSDCFDLKVNWLIVLILKLIDWLFQVAQEGTCQGGQGRYNARGFDLNRNFPDYFKNVSPPPLSPLPSRNKTYWGISRALHNFCHTLPHRVLNGL